MGNTSTSSTSPSSSSSTISSLNSSQAFGGVSLFDLPWPFVSVSHIMHRCSRDPSATGLIALKTVVLVTALLANSALLWLLYKSRRSLTPSLLLAMQICIVDMLSCLSLCYDLCLSLTTTSETGHQALDSLRSLKIFACPLFLTLMCVERLVAAVFPVTYLRLGKCSYRLAVSVAAWLSVALMSVLAYFFESLQFDLFMAAMIVVFFLVMLWCLAGIAWVLCRDRPGEGVRSNSRSVKSRMLWNIVTVLVPSVMAYAPLLVLVGYLALIVSKGTELLSTEQCGVIYSLLACPNLGLYIGPLFYRARIQQESCCRRREHRSSETQPKPWPKDPQSPDPES
uniref:G-protein coupled receptors family 1 profile domain-containing protein n=1 Tax=Knipowitschia caucasica TaxID=637954 RepID=A0AAV2L1K5_KNICA